MRSCLLNLAGMVFLALIPLNLFSQNQSDLDTALSGAVRRNDLSLVKKLVSKGADINFQNDTGATILMLAVNSNDLKMVKYLTDKGADIRKKGKLDNGLYLIGNAISVAVVNRNPEILYSLFHKCMCKIEKDEIDYTLKSNPEKHFDLKDFNPKDQVDGVVLSYLFFNGADIINLFDLIGFDGSEWSTKTYLNYYIDSIYLRGPHDRSLLHAAALYNRLDLAGFLLKNGATDDQDDKGATPYYLAKQAGNKEMMKLLLSYDTDSTLVPYEVTEKEDEREAELKIQKPLKPVLGLPFGHTKQIKSASFSSDGKLVITGSEDNTAKIWEASSGKLLKSLDKHSSYVENAAFSPNNKYIVTQTIDSKINIWSLESLDLLQSFTGNGQVPAIFSSDSKTIFTAGYYSIQKHKVLTGKSLTFDKGHSRQINTLSINPDSTLLLTASDDSTAKVWEISTENLIYTLSGINASVKQASFSHNGRFILTLSADSLVRLWETSSGKLVSTLKGHKSIVSNASFSPDDKYILTQSNDNSVKVWNAADGNLLYTKTQYNLYSNATVAFTPDNRFLYTKRDNDSFRIWDISSGALLDSVKIKLIEAYSFPEENKFVLMGMDSTYTIKVPGWEVIKRDSTSRSLSLISKRILSPDKKYLLQTGNNYESFGIQIFDISTGHLTANMFRSESGILEADFFRSRDSIMIVSGQHIGNLDTRDGHELKQILQSGSKSSFLSPDEKLIALIVRWFDFKVYNTGTGKRIINDYIPKDITSVSFSPSSDKVAVSLLDSTVIVWDCLSGKQIKKLTGLPGKINYIAFSRDGNYLGIGTFSGDVLLYNTGDFSKLKVLEGPDTGINYIDFSHNGKLLVTAQGDSVASLWDITSGSLLFKLKYKNTYVSKAFFSNDDKAIITSSSSTARLPYENSKSFLVTTLLGEYAPLATIKVWDTNTGTLIGNLEGHKSGIEDISFSSDGKYLLSASTDHTAIIWDWESKKLLFKLEGHSSKVNSARFSNDGKYVITAGDDSRLKIWDAATGKEILTRIPVGDKDWVVMSPAGLFDASPGALSQMYYVQGLDVIDLAQIKERYYEPNLWSKLLGFNDEPVRDVKGLDEIKLYPKVDLRISNDLLSFDLIDQGGGIGQYMVYINGKEAYSGNNVKDSVVFRGEGKISSSFNLRNHPYLIPGKENEIVIKAYNGENYLVNRGEKISYIPKGTVSSDKPRLFILTSGISDYTGDQIDLRFAARDADNITSTLEIGAKRLFGSEKTFTYKLSTDLPDKANWPTKQNILAAFGKIAGLAKSSDIVIVYISGHGINLGEQDGDFYYLTQDAYTSSREAYKDKAIRDKTTISSAELTELIRKIPALKQVLIIDACGSGRAVENLIAQRDISSSTLRALDRMKDRTGLHIITGCAADAVSYEASRYGQGVLTYSLLEAMKGASLREDKFADVIQLFQYSRERVPALAKGIGGIQQPQTFSPFGETSFDIGEFDAGDKSLIPLAAAKPVILMSSLKDKETFDDILGIEKLVDDRLREISSTDNTGFVFLDTKDFPEAFKIRGQYSISGNNVAVTVNLFKGSVKTSSFVINGMKNDLKKISDEIVRKLTL